MGPYHEERNLFRSIEYDEEFWENYLAGRPKYSQEFYQMILDYHNAHSSSSAIAHDIGTGPGQVAAVLANHFDHIVASDNNATHLAVAQQRLLELYAAKKIDFEIASGEDIASKHSPASADFVSAAECMSLMDAELAVKNFASLLRPGGTLAMWFYGRPAFAEENESARQCQSLYNRIVNKSYAVIIAGATPARRAQWKKTMDRIESWLDDIALPGDQWTYVQRCKWNADLIMPFFDDSAVDFDFEHISRVDTAAETVTERADRGFWAERWNVQEVHRFVDALIPSFKQVGSPLEGDEEIKKWYRELASAMGGEDSKRDIAWPVVLILATRK